MKSALKLRIVAGRLRAPLYRRGGLATVAILGALVGLHHAAASGTRGAGRAALAAEPACGPAAARTAAAAALVVAERIYSSELTSREVRSDRRQVERNGPLLAALAASNVAQTKTAVEALVYSGTHIVRLRISRGARVIADVGGPYVLAPVEGSLRVGRRVLAHYSLSVQDDLGYVKLEKRLIGAQLLLARGGRALALEGAITPKPSTVPPNGSLLYHGSTFQTASFAARAFPSGPLRVTLLIPPPPASTASCLSVRATELGLIAQTTWRRYHLIGASPASFVVGIGQLTGALTFVRAGARQIAGSVAHGPAHLPDTGRVSYRGVSEQVRSFPARVGASAVRVYELIGG